MEPVTARLAGTSVAPQRRRPVAVQPGPRRGQPALVVGGVAALVPAAVFAILRFVPPSDDATALVASFIGAGAVFALAGLWCLGVALLRARHRAPLAVVTLLAAVLLAGHVTWQAPLFLADERPAGSTPFTLLTLNTHNGRADPAEVVAAAGAADVVVLVELTAAAVQALDERGWRARFPYTAGVVAHAPADTAVFSRFPLTGSDQTGDGWYDQRVTVAVPGIGQVRLVAVHPCNPYCGQDRWAAEHATLLRGVEGSRGRPLIVAGDFNAVDDHGPMQRLRRLGLRSATDLVGAGWVPTYPANRLVPPLLPIDHVLVDDHLTATSLQRVPIAGTDHLGLLVTLAPTG